MPMQDILGSMPLDQEIKDALLGRSGRLGSMLTLVEALEEADLAEIEQALAKLPMLDHGKVPAMQVEAMRWANSIGEMA